VKFAKFDEAVEVALNLGVNPRHADQMVRGAVVYPHGLGKTVRVAVFAKGDKEIEAREAGADFVGGEELVKKIQTENWLDFDKAIATPDMMGLVGRIGRLLGPRGLMPNPKVGTVTFEIGRPSRDEGGPRRVPRRQGGHRARARRPDLVRDQDNLARQHSRAHRHSSCASSRRVRRASTCKARRSQLHDGSGHQARHQPDRRQERNN
jgi:hypothetical protein